MIIESSKKGANIFQKVIGILTQPNLTLAALEAKQSESVIIVLVLYVLVCLKGAIELVSNGEGQLIGRLILGSALGIAVAWFGLAIVYHFSARILGGSGNFRNTWFLLGYIAAPMVLTSFLSLIIYIISPVLKPTWGGDEWGALHAGIGWIGMIWSWPGILCYDVLRYGENLPHLKAVIIVGVVFSLTLIGWFMPVLVPAWFG